MSASEDIRRLIDDAIESGDITACDAAMEKMSESERIAAAEYAMSRALDFQAHERVLRAEESAVRAETTALKEIAADRDRLIAAYERKIEILTARIAEKEARYDDWLKQRALARGAS